MKSHRKRRLMIALILVLGTGLALGFALYALKQNINLYFTPTQIRQGQAPVAHEMRVGGEVKSGSFQHLNNAFKVRFVVTDNKSDTTVFYTGLLPDLFREGQGIVIQGKLLANGSFLADQVLAKHGEYYHPKKVAA